MHISRGAALAGLMAAVFKSGTFRHAGVSLGKSDHVRRAKVASRNRWPHQGQKECERRRRQLGHGEFAPKALAAA